MLMQEKYRVMNRDEILKFLKANLKPKRLAHSLGVEKAACDLARRFGCDEGKAALAGLAHDCAKSLDAALLADYAAEAGFPIDELSLRSPQILHAPAGATLARRELGIENPEVLGAICWHAVPRENMTMLEKVVSVADLIEENRDYDGVEAVRRAACDDLDEAFRLSLARTIVHVASEGLPLHPDTVKVYNGLCVRALSPGPSPYKGGGGVR
jgi:predicted HD superfamily hydrolase involved in NAD metabolism